MHLQTKTNVPASNPDARYQIAKKVTLIGALMNALLGLAKLTGGILFHSHGLIADGLHSFSDLVVDATVVLASKYGSQHADDSHPYGHQRIETAATFFLALLLILTGLAIAWDSMEELFHRTYESPKIWSIPIAIISLIINELLFYYTKHISHIIKSDLLLANAWHHRSDAASSLVVLAGLIGSLAGYPYLDAIAAIIVGVLIIHMGVTYSWNSIKELIDTAVDAEQLNKIEEVVRETDGVKKIHQLRTRTMGQDIFIDLHIIVSPWVSVSEGHFIAQIVHHDLVQKVPNVRDVTVHVDPEDDETSSPCLHLPNRSFLEKHLLLSWQHDYPELLSWVIHYLDGKIILDLILSTQPADKNKFYQRVQNDLKTLDNPIELRILLADNTTC